MFAWGKVTADVVTGRLREVGERMELDAGAGAVTDGRGLRTKGSSRPC